MRWKRNWQSGASTSPCPQNSEEVIVSQVGWKLYEMFFKNYTRKQWHRDAKDLDPSVCGRIPIRTNRDDRYLSEKFQALPNNGYTPMFQKMLSHPKIEVRLNTDYREARKYVQFNHLIFTGPIDEYYDHCFGRLPYRSLRFEPESLLQECFQPTMQVNFPNDHDFHSDRGNQTRYGSETPFDNDRARVPAGFRTRSRAVLSNPRARCQSTLSKVRGARRLGKRRQLRWPTRNLSIL